MNSDVRHSAEYKRVINSPRWRKLREQLIHAYDSVCQRCKKKSDKLSLHHKNYERLGKERLTDLELVCENCHPSADEERKRAGQDSRAAASYDRAQKTYFTKKFGEENLGYQTPNDEAQFADWVTRKEESRNQGYSE